MLSGCDECRGITQTCPICGHGSDEENWYFDELENHKADEADNYNDEQKLNEI